MYTEIKTFEDGCKKLSINPANLPDCSMLPELHRKALLAHTKLIIIAQALNDGWQPNWNNWKEYKYYPWFDINSTPETPSGSGLSCDDYGRTYTGTAVGSRLCYKSREIAKYAGVQFLELYTEYFLFI